MNFTDLHSHTAWGIDDGIDTKEHAAQAIAMAKADGICRILSTPHVKPGVTTKEDIKFFRQRQKELYVLAASEGVEIFSGAEVRLNDELIPALEAGWLPLINNGPYMLVEYSVREDYSLQHYTTDLLYEITVRQIHPVIAHVERYFFKGLDYDVIDEWRTAGYVFQINATSLLGQDSSFAKKNAWDLIKKGYAHVVSTDTHRIQGARIENLSKAYSEVEKKFGSKTASLLFKDNPDHILKGEPVEDLPKPEKRSFFHFGRPQR